MIADLPVSIVAHGKDDGVDLLDVRQTVREMVVLGIYLTDLADENIVRTGRLFPREVLLFRLFTTTGSRAPANRQTGPVPASLLRGSRAE
jgi:hypothetical protein